VPLVVARASRRCRCWRVPLRTGPSRRSTCAGGSTGRCGTCRRDAGRPGTPARTAGCGPRRRRVPAGRRRPVGWHRCRLTSPVGRGSTPPAARSRSPTTRPPGSPSGSTCVRAPGAVRRASRAAPAPPPRGDTPGGPVTCGGAPLARRAAAGRGGSVDGRQGLPAAQGDPQHRGGRRDPAAQPLRAARGRRGADTRAGTAHGGAGLRGRRRPRRALAAARPPRGVVGAALGRAHRPAPPLGRRDQRTGDCHRAVRSDHRVG
jgi:hypothetical protein